MRHENDLCPQECRRPDVLDDVIVVTDQYTTFPAEKLEHTVFVAWFHMRVNERMQLSIFDNQSIAVHANAGFV
jgi:hypothetical protein